MCGSSGLDNYRSWHWGIILGQLYFVIFFKHQFRDGLEEGEPCTKMGETHVSQAKPSSRADRKFFRGFVRTFHW